MPLPRLSDRRHTSGGKTRRVTLYKPGDPSPDGGSSPPSPFCSCWADIHSLRGQELDKAALIAQVVELIVTISYRRGIKQNMLVGFEGEMWQITHIQDEDRRHIDLDLYVSEVGQNAGGSA